MMKFTELLKSFVVNDKNISFIPDDFTNVIFYGSQCSKKYEHALKFIQNMSPSSLNYERKITISYNNNEFIYKISDIHIEINLEFLGCISKSLWSSIYEQVLLFTLGKPFIILCKNFSKINNDLLTHFYSYMNDNNKNIRFILLISNLSFIPKEIVDLSLVVPIKSSVQKNKKIIQTELLSKVVTIITNHTNSNINEIRTLLYDILIYQIDVYDFFYLLLEKINEIKKPTNAQFIKLLNNLNKVLKLFNNYYRSIYHLENFILTIIDDLYI